jgi:unsaturated rhamnogalacturonyl hydrolase
MRPGHVRRVTLALLALLACVAGSLAALSAQTATPMESPGAGAPELDEAQVRETIRRVADWHMEHPYDYPPGYWTMAPLYDGLIDASLVLNEPRYLAAVIREGREVDFAPGENLGDADSHAAGRAWLRIYQMDPERDPEELEDFEARFAEILEERERGLGWSWIDALYMVPPTLAELATTTGDGDYLDLAYTEALATYEELYDEDEDLFYRDEEDKGTLAPNGEKVLWGRGNGWAYAALAELLNTVPSGHESRQFYLDLFRDMSDDVLEAQQPDGLWYPSLLDPEQVPIGETSASALLLYGMAWGVNQGVLEQETYLPAVERGWDGLLTRIRPDGEVDFAQPVGEVPELFDPDNSEPFASGAVLGAGSQIVLLLDDKLSPAALRAEAERLADEAPALSRDEE